MRTVNGRIPSVPSAFFGELNIISLIARAFLLLGGDRVFGVLTRDRLADKVQKFQISPPSDHCGFVLE